MRTRQAPRLIGQKILVTIDRWDATSRYPEGHFVRALGAVGGKETEQESLLLEFDVPYRPFGAAVLSCLPPEGDSWVVPPRPDDTAVDKGAWRDREDLRGEIICSIDPPGMRTRSELRAWLTRAQAARISTMHCTRSSSLTATSRPASVSC